MSKAYKILSVQRISDGEVFSVGDELVVYDSSTYIRKIAEIIADETYEGGLYVTENDGSYPVNGTKATSAITIISKAK